MSSNIDPLDFSSYKNLQKTNKPWIREKAVLTKQIVKKEQRKAKKTRIFIKRRITEDYELQNNIKEEDIVDVVWTNLTPLLIDGKNVSYLSLFIDYMTKRYNEDEEYRKFCEIKEDEEGEEEYCIQNKIPYEKFLGGKIEVL
jgi:Fe-S cluster assembly iron-binding protein IscA